MGNIFNHKFLLNCCNFMFLSQSLPFIGASLKSAYNEKLSRRPASVTAVSGKLKPYAKFARAQYRNDLHKNPPVSNLQNKEKDVDVTKHLLTSIHTTSPTVLCTASAADDSQSLPFIGASLKSAYNEKLSRRPASVTAVSGKLKPYAKFARAQYRNDLHKNPPVSNLQNKEKDVDVTKHLLTSIHTTSPTVLCTASAADDICGGFLIFGGFYIFSDTKRILLSRLLASTSEQLNSLPQPLFYYISFGLAVAGTIAVLASIIGFWASCLNTYCFLSLYFLTVVILLLAESVVCLAITLWPHCLGINLDATKMVKALQGNYGIPGREQFTIAMDLAQTRFGCCGINSEINYDTAMWRLQGYGPREWVVPLTCCILSNEHEPLAYLDPKPSNETQCQTLHKIEFSKHRHTKPCLEYLDIWYREQYGLFLGISFLIAIVEFFVLLSIILNCTKISRRSCKVEDFLEMRTRAKSNQTLVENIYGPDIVDTRMSPLNSALRGGHRVPGEFKEIYIQPQELLKSRHNTTFKPGRSHYHISTRSYLV